MSRKEKEIRDYILNVVDINDDVIIKIFYNGLKRINTHYKKIVERNVHIKHYLENRFLDSESLNETFYRIYHKMYIRPVCEICGGHVNWDRHGFLRYCSTKCSYSNEGRQNMVKHLKESLMIKYGVDNVAKANIIKEKIQNTNLKRYGVTCSLQSEHAKSLIEQNNIKKYGCKYVLQSDIIKEKIKKTNLERYGAENPYGSDIIKLKIKETSMNLYNVDHYMKSDKAKQRIKEINLKKYGYDYYMQTNEFKEKAKETLFKKYGVDSYAKSEKFKKYMLKLIKSEDFLKKIYNTKKKNGTLHSSNIERLFDLYLNENYKNDYISQYKSKEYPFNCDFYIKSLNLYIEILGFWTHGYHPYDATNPNDIATLQKLKEKEQEKIKKYSKSDYTNAINTWTLSDVIKRTTAKINKLNYLEIFSCNINECIKILNEYIKNNKLK